MQVLSEMDRAINKAGTCRPSNGNPIDSSEIPLDVAKNDRVMRMSDRDLLIALGFNHKTADALVEFGMHKLEKQFADQIEWSLGRKLTGSEKGKLGALSELIRRGRNNHGQTIATPEEAFHHLQDIRNEQREMFKVLYLDSRGRLMSGRIISIGTLCQTLCGPREILVPAFEMAARSIICAHNHPSGEIYPSAEDKTMNRHIWEACRMFGVDLRDNLIVARGNEEVFSMRKAGMIV